jgi:hypothetical protein
VELLILISLYTDRSRDSPVVYSAGLRTGLSGVRVPAGAGNFSLHHRVETDCGAHPASFPLKPGAVSLEVKRPGREADHSHPSSAEVKNAGGYTSIPPIRLHGVVLSTGTLPYLTLPYLP